MSVFLVSSENDQYFTTNMEWLCNIFFTVDMLCDILLNNSFESVFFLLFVFGRMKVCHTVVMLCSPVVTQKCVYCPPSSNEWFLIAFSKSIMILFWPGAFINSMTHSTRPHTITPTQDIKCCLLNYAIWLVTRSGFGQVVLHAFVLRTSSRVIQHKKRSCSVVWR